MDFSSIKDFLKEDLDKVNKLMATSLSTDIELLDKTNRAILSHNGKQVRPVLTLLVARACSGGFVTDDTIKYAAAVELLHNATLLHDDVADDSPVRRGAPTVMSILGGRASVLLGDYWLVKGMENILASRNSSDKVIRIFASTLTDLAEGGTASAAEGRDRRYARKGLLQNNLRQDGIIVRGFRCSRSDIGERY